MRRRIQWHERVDREVEPVGSDRSDGSPRTEVRLSGIYALERLLAEADSEYWPIMEVFGAYVREHAVWRADVPLKRDGQARGATAGPIVPPADVQAILPVMGRRKAHHHGAADKRLLDLART